MKGMQHWKVCASVPPVADVHCVAAGVQVHAAHVRGMGAKAMLVLATLAAEPELLHVLRALLQPQDYACLVHIAHRAVRAIARCQPVAQCHYPSALVLTVDAQARQDVYS